MFGLMRVKKCGMSEAEKDFRRLHYCGTCKTIGSLYGQKSRLLLNHDAVFLAEILTSLSGGEEKISDWQNAYQSYNCLNLPKNGEMPLPLEFAAAANLILAEFKLADKITDENSRAGKIARKTFSNGFQKARRKLEREWQFPLDEVRELLSAQETIEDDSLQSDKAPGKILDELSRPTAETTAIFFGEGAQVIGKSKLKNAAAEIGFRFGKLIYLVDAFEDFEKDFRRGQFNAIRAAFRVDEEKLPPEIRRKVVSILRKLEGEIVAGIYKLPVTENQKTLFASRLAQNLQRKLKPSLPVLKTKKACQPKPLKPKQSFSERWKTASEAARKMARGFSWQMPVVFLFVFAFALVAPAQTREAKSARECFDLSFNLMFLSAIFGSVPAFPKAVRSQKLSPENLAEKAERKRREGWCDWCDCECCECCGEGCCCGCDNCGCDGCCDCDGCCCDCSCD